jgi:hypothetical protein
MWFGNPDVFGPSDLCSRAATAKAEVLQDKDNPRFIVTNLPAKGFEDKQPQCLDRFCAQKCYEDFYCARGDMQNQIKQQYLDLDADRTSTHWMASNQLRLWFSAFALLIFQRLRTLALQGNPTGQGDRRYHPATVVKDRRHGHGKHPPGLRSAGVGISPSGSLRPSTSGSGSLGAR